MAVDEEKKIKLSEQIVKLAQDDILIHLRFFDMAVFRLPWKIEKKAGLPYTDQKAIFYDPTWLISQTKTETTWCVRTYLHILFHCIFSHAYGYDKVDQALWDLAADIAVENAILELQLPWAKLERDTQLQRKIEYFKGEIGSFTADKLYRYLAHNPISQEEWEELTLLSKRDSHISWVQPETLELTQADWKKISERVKADLKSFTKGKTGSETLVKNLEEATRENVNYEEMLRQFTVTGEDMCINDDEFDYVYYTYGLREYGNMPLIEALEYKEVKKVKEFVIAIDTSASCRGEIVKAFLNHTYSILKSAETYFQKMNLHIIQCDSEVRSDTKVTSQEEFDTFMQYGKLTGFGATDFRPVFEYVDKLLEQGEFENLKGLIFFTDGYGIYPERMPKYDVIFAFLEEDEYRAPVPPWSRKVIVKEMTYEH